MLTKQKPHSTPCRTVAYRGLDACLTSLGLQALRVARSEVGNSHASLNLYKQRGFRYTSLMTDGDI
jgi:hypothetical protein